MGITGAIKMPFYRCNATCRFLPCTAASKDLTNGIPKHAMSQDGHLVQTYTLLHTCQNM